MKPTVSLGSLLCVFLTASCVTVARETIEDAANLARNLVDNSPNSVGVIASNYPLDHPNLPGEPFALQEYYASCFSNGSLALLMFPISQTTKNVFDSSNPNRTTTLTMQHPHPAAELPRVALMGTLTKIESGLFESTGVEECFVSRHLDTSGWTPSKWGTHASFWARFDIHAIYYVGGFGGIHYIGYVPQELYAKSGQLTTEGSQQRFKIQSRHNAD